MPQGGTKLIKFPKAKQNADESKSKFKKDEKICLSSIKNPILTKSINSQNQRDLYLLHQNVVPPKNTRSVSHPQGDKNNLPPFGNISQEKFTLGNNDRVPAENISKSNREETLTYNLNRKPTAKGTKRHLIQRGETSS